MEKLLLLLLFCQVSSSVKHSLKFFYTATSGIPNFPDYVIAAELDDVPVGYCNSHNKIIETKHDWMKKLFENEPQHLELFAQYCVKNGPAYFKATIDSLKQRYNQSGGVHVLQRMNGCEWDDETGEINGFNQYGYHGEDFISFDLKTSTWITPEPKAFITKLRWDAEKYRVKENEVYLTKIFPEWLKKYVDYGKSALLRTVRFDLALNNQRPTFLVALTILSSKAETVRASAQFAEELPSVSLLQKTPSSPVSCHATGFYPDRATLIWRKDGEELQEGVHHREILPNHDGTFQMSVDLNISSVTPEDWRRYECVFHLSGVKDDIVTRLDKAVIRTNWEKPSDMTGSITATVVVVIIITATGFIVYKKKKKKAECSLPCPDNGSELSESLNDRCT